jgi:hypothetical protein
MLLYGVKFLYQQILLRVISTGALITYISTASPFIKILNLLLWSVIAQIIKAHI